MLDWLIALAAGLLLAAITYAGRAAGRRAPLGVGAAALRAVAAALLVALLLDAPIGRAAVPPPLVALDVSASWLRGGDSAAYRRARDSAARHGDGQPLLIGDTLRLGSPPAHPADLASRVRPAVERAVAAGRALVVVTDGELDDADALERLPRGSRTIVVAPVAGVDAAVATLESARAAVGGDTIDVTVRLAAGARGAPAGRVRIAVDGVTVDSAATPSLPAFGELRLPRRVPLPRREGHVLLSARVGVPGDAEPANDSVAVPIDLSAAAGVTVVSTAPDYDLRYMLEVLRGTVALPTRAYLEIAPGRWRLEGSLAPASEETVRDALRRSPIVVLHGDTARFGPPGTVGQGALLLAATVAEGEADWYATAAPPSPLAAGLSGTPWDSLPPLVVGSTEPRGDWQGLVVQRARRFERRTAVAGREEPRRRAVVGVSGLWRWRFRGGAAADAYAALWGGIFDWLAAERRDARGAVPEAALVRAGEPLRWRRGGTDSVVSVVLRRRGAADSTTLTLRFAGGASVATSPPMPAGVYDVRVPGGSAVVAVNASRELLPRRPALRSGPVGRSPAPLGVAPSLRSLGWVYVLLVLLLCGEWLLRRRVGLR
ncbi:MAG TPA: hypothetical protein VFS08_21100 [Gemmatimonadaceae bacterium]|nr:hypothetical protein [Gemmatimonadaceae bacterium]